MGDSRANPFLAVFQDAGIDAEPADSFDIDDLQQSLGIQFPPAYIAFLLCAGHGFPPFVGARHAIDDDLASVQRSVPRTTSSSTGIPTDAYVFFAQQGFAFRYFLTGDGDDPPVYEFVQGWDPPNRKLADSFSKFIINQNG